MSALLGLPVDPIFSLQTYGGGFFIASGVMDNLSFRAGLGTSELVPFFDLLSAIFLTIAFPQWKVIIETVTSAQAASLEQLSSSHLGSSPQE